MTPDAEKRLHDQSIQFARLALAAHDTFHQAVQKVQESMAKEDYASAQRFSVHQDVLMNQVGIFRGLAELAHALSGCEDGSHVSVPDPVVEPVAH